MNSTKLIKFYNRISRVYDLFSIFETRAKTTAFSRLDLQTDTTILNAGLGTGIDINKFTHSLDDPGSIFGIDISGQMLKMSQRRGYVNLAQADVNHLPYRNGSFDRIYSAFLFDLLPEEKHQSVLSEMHRVLTSQGKLVIINMTKGRDIPSKMIIRCWNWLYKLNPLLCGGCRPVDLKHLLSHVGFQNIEEEYISQMGFPSMILGASK